MAHLTKGRKIYLQITQELQGNLLICVLCGFLFLSSFAWADIKFSKGHRISVIVIGASQGPEQITIGGLIGEPRVEIQGLPGGDVSLATTGMSGEVANDNQFLRRFTSVTMGKTIFSREVTAEGGIAEGSTKLIIKSSSYENNPPQDSPLFAQAASPILDSFDFELVNPIALLHSHLNFMVDEIKCSELRQFQRTTTQAIHGNTSRGVRQKLSPHGHSQPDQ